MKTNDPLMVTIAITDIKNKMAFRNFFVQSIDMTKKDITAAVIPLIDILKEGAWRIDESLSQREAEAITTCIKKRTAAPKEDLLLFTIILFSQRDLFNTLFNRFPQNIQELINTLIYETSSIYKDAIDKNIRKAITLKRTYLYYDQDCVMGKPYTSYQGLFTIISEYNSNYHITLNMSANLLYTFALTEPKEYQTHPLEKDPDISKLKIFNAEDNVWTEWTHFQWLVENGQIDIYDTTASGTLKTGIAATLQKRANVVELFTDKKMYDLSTRRLRSRILSNIFALAYQEKNDDLDACLLKNIATALRRRSVTFPIIYYFLAAKSLEHHYGMTDVTLAQYNILKSLTEEGWYSTDELLKTERRNPYIIPCVNDLKRQFSDRYYYIFKQYPSKKDITLEDTFLKPAINGAILIYASLGLMEVAYREAERGDISIFDTVKYFRFTDYGLSLLGVKKDYKSNRNQASGIKLDDTRLIFKLEDENMPGASYIIDTATPISGGRYHVTLKSFLKSCKTPSDVEKNVRIYEKLTGGNLPTIWKDFFLDVINKSQALQPLRSSGYCIYQLTTNDIHLMQIFVSDPKLSKICHRATGNIIIYPVQESNTFKSVLASYGYIIK